MRAIIEREIFDYKRSVKHDVAANKSTTTVWKAEDDLVRRRTGMSLKIFIREVNSEKTLIS